MIVASVPPLWAVAIRTGIGAVALTALALATRRLARPPRADLPVLVSITLLHMVGFTTLSSIGLELVPAGRSAVLAYTTPLWVVPGASLLLGERLTRRRVVGVVVGLAGLIVLFNPAALDWTRRTTVLGNVAILGAALLWAGAILHIRGHHWRSTPFDLLPWQMLLATVILVPLAALFAYAGLPGSALAYWASAMAGLRLPAATISLGLLATPVLSVALATLWLGERPGASLLVGVALILGGVALGTVGERPSDAAVP